MSELGEDAKEGSFYLQQHILVTIGGRTIRALAFISFSPGFSPVIVLPHKSPNRFNGFPRSRANR